MRRRRGGERRNGCPPRMARLVPGRLVGCTSRLAEFLSLSSHRLPRTREVKRGSGFHLPYVPRWRNGRRRGLKILRAQAHAGSSPALGTKICLSFTDRVCGDLMPDRGRSVANLEGTCVLENVLVGERPARMLAHMLHPRIDDKVLDVAFGPFRIKEQPPEIRPVAPPDYSKLQHRLLEFACSFRVDCILDGDQNRTRFGRNWLRQLGIGIGAIGSSSSSSAPAIE